MPRYKVCSNGSKLTDHEATNTFAFLQEMTGVNQLKATELQAISRFGSNQFYTRDLLNFPRQLYRCNP